MSDGAETTNGFTSPARQVMNLIRYIGDEVSKSGEPIREFSGASITSTIGAPSEKFATSLIEELCQLGTIKIAHTRATRGNPKSFLDVNLTFDGWERYETEKRGGFDGNYGFLAMQFGDAPLDAFVESVLKPAVKEGTGFDLFDMRDVPRAGIIDNIMRVQIRDAKFVVADLTHDNHGAYWEAGYAEGLGKPVIYICEKKKFEREGSHFDTNHCTTVLWSRDDEEAFRRELIATLRRSLDGAV